MFDETDFLTFLFSDNAVHREEQEGEDIGEAGPVFARKEGAVAPVTIDPQIHYSVALPESEIATALSPSLRTYPFQRHNQL